MALTERGRMTIPTGTEALLNDPFEDATCHILISST